MIVIITSEFDPHADSVIYALQELGFTDYIRIDLETAHKHFNFTIKINVDCFDWSIKSKHNPSLYVDAKKLKTIWWRRSTAFFKTDHLTLPTTKTVDEIESYWKIRLLIENINEDYFPLGHPTKMKFAENKIKQLYIASLCGFKIPESIFTNNKKDITDFLEFKSKIIVKPLKSNILFDEDKNEQVSLKTSINSRDKVMEIINNKNDFSVFSQSPIDKIADVRVTVFDKCIIACKIDTSSLSESEVDWRPNTFDFPHCIIKIPNSIEIKIKKFMDLMNIKSGYFDFGIDKKGYYHFIECNPNGQWLWIELKTGYKISYEIANKLIYNN